MLLVVVMIESVSVSQWWLFTFIKIVAWLMLIVMMTVLMVRRVSLASTLIVISTSTILIIHMIWVLWYCALISTLSIRIIIMLMSRVSRSLCNLVRLAIIYSVILYVSKLLVYLQTCSQEWAFTQHTHLFIIILVKVKLINTVVGILDIWSTSNIIFPIWIINHGTFYINKSLWEILLNISNFTLK